MKPILLILILLSQLTNAQPKGAYDTLKKMTKNGDDARKQSSDNQKKNELNKFLKFYIPSSITNAGFEPAAVSSLNLNFGDDEVKLKWGLSRAKDSTKDLKNSVGVTASAKAPDGVRTLFKYEESSTDFTTGAVFTYVVRHTPYVYKGERSSEEAYWLNFTGEASRDNAKIFMNDSTYEETIDYKVSFLISVNHYFNSWHPLLKNNIRKRNLWSLGIGLGHFNNYEDLDDRILRKGYVSDSFMTETKDVVGKLGPIKRNFGLMLRGSFFYPVSNPVSPSYLMIGVNVNSFGFGTANSTSNGNFGFYISKRKWDEDEKVLKDDFSFGIVADFASLENRSEDDYMKKNFSIQFISQIPLRWK